MKHSFTIILMVLVAACNHSNHNGAILNNAALVVEQYPDSALAMLDSIDASQLNKQQQAEYVLLYTQAKDKAFQDISADTAIFEVKDYFAQNKNWEKAALAGFYCGKVYSAKNDNANAMWAHLDAEHFALQTDNNKLKGLIQHNIAELYYDQDMCDDAIVRYKDAKKYFESVSDGYKFEISALQMIGNAFLLSDRKDSAFTYYNSALQLAEKYNDIQYQSKLLQNMGVVYRETGEYIMAKRYLFKAHLLTEDTVIRAKVYMNLVSVYTSTNQLDSATYYGELALKYVDSIDPFFKLSLYICLLTLEKKSGNYERLEERYSMYINALDSIHTGQLRLSILEVQKKYDFEVLRNEKSKLLIQRQRYIIAIFVLLSCLILGGFYFYRKNLRKENMLLSIRQRWYDILTERLQANKRVMLLESYLNDNDKGKVLLRSFEKVVSTPSEGLLDWETMYHSINDLMDGQLELLHKNYPQLDETEFRICCLTYAKFRVPEIAIILNLKENTIHRKRTAIRSKLGIGNRGDISGFLSQI